MHIKDEKDKKIYIVVSKTNTFLGKIIRAATRYDYNHASVAISSELYPMYSFARYHKNEPFFGGFVEESWKRYIVNHRSVKVKIYKINLSEEQYKEVNHKIQNFVVNKDKYKYDIIGAILGIKRQQTLQNNKYTCVTFISELLKGIDEYSSLGDTVNVKQLCEELSVFLERQMIVEDDEKYTWGNDKYFERRNGLDVISNIIKTIGRQFT